MYWYITKKAGKKQNKNAAGKAPADIASICDAMGMKSLDFPIAPVHWKKALFQKIWIVTRGTFPWMISFLKVGRDDVILLQYPFYGNRVIKKWVSRMKEKKGCHFVILIHDLESLRDMNQEMDPGRRERGLFGEKNILPLADAVICHNDVMKSYLISQGIEEEKLISLEIFDYLTECEVEERRKSTIPAIAIAGNLSPMKSSYIYDIREDNEKLKVHLFGVGYEKDKAPKAVIYHGSFLPEKLPKHLEGDFGLVWDGKSASTCAGGTGEYLRYNNPHKASLYLASNLPVVIWNEAALAGFVEEKKVGITVSSISEISEIIQSMSEADWNYIYENAKTEGEKLRQGYYTKMALEKAFDIISQSRGV